jgi:hypothetical protein
VKTRRQNRVVKAKAMMAKTELQKSESAKALGAGDVHSQALEDGGRNHGLVAEVALPQNEDGTQHDGENEAGNDRSVVPGLGVSSPLESQDEASDRSEDEGSSEPVHVEELAEPGLRSVLLRLRSERRRCLEQQGDGEESNTADGQVDVEAL